MNKLPISAIILTYNEEVNIELCLQTICEWIGEIIIVDSGSTDKTIEICKRYTQNIFFHDFKTYSIQFNWALANIPTKNEWVMRLDADEYVLPELRDELYARLSSFAPEISGLVIKRRVIFMDRWIKWGGCYPIWLLRIWKKGAAFCEERYMDEHMVVKHGRKVLLKNDIVDMNKKDLSWWVEKHNHYASREAKDLLNLRYHIFQEGNITATLAGRQDQRKRWLKENLYSKLPLFLRAFLYFIHRYFLKFGFLDGFEGLIWHFLQGFWYRFLVDAKIYEINKKSGRDKDGIRKLIYENYGVNLNENSNSK